MLLSIMFCLPVICGLTQQPYRILGDEKYLQLATRAYNYLSNFFLG